jgi:hypothetical protein
MILRIARCASKHNFASLFAVILASPPMDLSPTGQ